MLLSRRFYAYLLGIVVEACDIMLGRILLLARYALSANILINPNNESLLHTSRNIYDTTLALSKFTLSPLFEGNVYSSSFKNIRFGPR